MKLQQLNEYEEQLSEASRSKVFAIAGSIFGMFGTAVSYAVFTAGVGISGALPLAIIGGSLYGAYMGGIASIFAKGKQRTLYDTIISLVKKRDKLIGEVKGKKQDDSSVKKFEKIQKLTIQIKKNTEQLDKLLDVGKGGAGLARRQISPKEKEQISSIIKAGKGESGDLLSFKYNIDVKKIK